MPDSSQDIHVKVSYDDSQLQDGAGRSKRKLGQLGDEAKKSAKHIEEIQNAADRFGGHLLLYAVPGGERLAFVMERLGIASLGAATMLAALVPVAVVAGLLALEHEIEAVKLAEDSAATATQLMGNKINDSLMEQKEHWIGLTQGPIAEAVQKLKDFDKEESNLPNVMKNLDSQLDADTHAWGYLGQVVSNTGKYLENFMHHGLYTTPKNVGIDETALKDQIQLIVQADSVNGKYAEGIKALYALRQKVAAAGDIYSKEELGALDTNIQWLAQQQKEAIQQKKNLAQEATEKEETYKQNLAVATITGVQNAAITAQRATTEAQRTADQESVAHARAQLDLITQAGKQKLANLTPANQELATAQQYLAIKKQTITNIGLEESAKNAVALATKKEQDDEVKNTQDAANLKLLSVQKEMQVKIAGAANDEARHQAQIDAAERESEAQAGVNEAKVTGAAKTAASQKAYTDSVASNHAEALAEMQRADTEYTNNLKTITTEDTEAQLASQQRLLTMQQRRIEQEYELQELEAKGLKRPAETKLGGFVGAVEMRPKNEGQLRVEANAAQAAAQSYKTLAEQQEKAIQAQLAYMNKLPQGSKELLTAREQLIEMGEAYNQDIANYQKYVTKKVQLDQQMQIQWRQAVQSMTNDFNQGLEAWMSGHERFSVAMAKAVQKMIVQFIMARVVQVEQAALGAAQVNAITRLQHMFQVTTSAKSAAASTMATTPFPASLPLAGAALASTLAFAQQGAVLPEDTMLYAHKNEMVLPPDLSKFVQQAAATAAHQREPNQTAGNFNLHYSPHVQAIDTVGMADQLKAHSKLVTNMVQKQLRRGNHI